MTAAGVHTSPPGATPARARRQPPWPPHGVLRLARLHLASRRVPAALGALGACGVVLRAALHWHWGQGSGPAAQFVPLVIEAATAAIITVTTTSPFGEPERATGRWLPYLRLSAALALTAAAAGALGAGAAAAHLPGGTLDVLRDVAGLTGIGLLCAAVLGGALAWLGPMAYLIVAEYALTGGWTTPWIWPARPPHDLGAAVCAGLLFGAGTAVITVRGSRDQGMP